MIPAISTAAVLIVGVAVFRTGRGPITLAIRAGLRIQGEWMWLCRCAWPAVKRERYQVERCVQEAHRRVVESAPLAPTRETVAEELLEPPPGSARSGLWGRLKGSVAA